MALNWRILSLSTGALKGSCFHRTGAEKFLENCALTIPAAAAQQLWSAILGLDEMDDVTELMSLLRTKASGA